MVHHHLLTVCHDFFPISCRHIQVENYLHPFNHAQERAMMISKCTMKWSEEGFLKIFHVTEENVSNGNVNLG